MSALRQDLCLSCDIILDAWGGSSRGGEKILEEAGEDNEDLIFDPVEEWQIARRELPSMSARMGADIATAFLTWQQQAAQEHFLKYTALGISGGYSIISSPPKGNSRGARSFKTNFRKAQFENYKTLAKLQLKSKLKMQVFKVPITGIYSGKQFKADLRSQIRAFKRGTPLLSMLFAPIGLQVLFAPPKGDKNGVRDIDNVMRTVVPLIHEEFAPPLSLMHTTDLSKLEPELRQRYEKWLAEYPKGLKHQILNYEIFRVPADRATEASGQIAVGLCEGFLKKNLLDKTQNVIGAWWENLDE